MRPAPRNDLGQGEAVYVGHRDVGQDRTNGVVYLKNGDSFLPVTRFENAVASFRQNVVCEQPDEGFVLDQQNDNGGAVVHIRH